MSVQLGYQGTSKSTPSIVYFNVTVPTDGSSHKLGQLETTNGGKKIDVPKDFVVSQAQLATVPNNVNVKLEFGQNFGYDINLTSQKTQQGLNAGTEAYPQRITASINK